MIAWIQDIDEGQIFLSAVTAGELQAGMELTRPQDHAKAQEIEWWLDKIGRFQQILPMDARAFREWARLMHGRTDDLLEDAMIAATARVHRLTIATRNTRDFASFDVPLFNPFTAK